MAAQSTKHPQNILNTLRAHKSDLSMRYHLTGLGIFGSTARNEALQSSDIDVVIRTSIPDPFQLVNLKEELETLLKSEVDLVG